MTSTDEIFLRNWLNLPGVKAALRKEFPKVITQAKSLGVGIVRRLVTVTSCGASQAELNSLYRVLDDERVIAFDGITIRPLAPSTSMSS